MDTSDGTSIVARPVVGAPGWSRAPSEPAVRGCRARQPDAPGRASAGEPPGEPRQRLRRPRRGLGSAGRTSTPASSGVCGASASLSAASCSSLNATGGRAPSPDSQLPPCATRSRACTSASRSPGFLRDALMIHHSDHSAAITATTVNAEERNAPRSTERHAIAGPRAEAAVSRGSPRRAIVRRAAGARLARSPQCLPDPSRDVNGPFCSSW